MNETGSMCMYFKGKGKEKRKRKVWVFDSLLRWHDIDQILFSCLWTENTVFLWDIAGNPE